MRQWTSTFEIYLALPSELVGGAARDECVLESENENSLGRLGEGACKTVAFIRPFEQMFGAW